MDRVNTDTLRDLVELETKLCASLYMPLHPGVPHRRQDAVRFKNLVAQAKAGLAKQGSTAEAKRILSPLVEQPDGVLANRGGFRGFACFAAEDYFRAFLLPTEVAEACVVGDRFAISPLLPLMHYDGRFFVLALSQNEVHLYETTRHTIGEWDLPAIKAPVADDPDPQMQHFSYRSPSQGRGNTGETMFHGQGASGDRDKSDVLEYCRAVDRSVCTALAGQSAPLALACVESLAPVYAKANNYPHLVVGCIAGNHDRAQRDELHAAAWAMVEPHFEQLRQQALANFERVRGGDLAEVNPNHIATAAEQGRIATLLVHDELCRAAGTNHREASRQTPADGMSAPELVRAIESAAAQTILHGGEVVALADTPTEESPVAAVLRY